MKNSKLSKRERKQKRKCKIRRFNRIMETYDTFFTKPFKLFASRYPIWASITLWSVIIICVMILILLALPFYIVDFIKWVIPTVFHPFKTFKEIRNKKKEKQEKQRKENKRLMKYALIRDGRKCVRCGASADDGVKLHVASIIPVSKDDKIELSNLRTLCEKCESEWLHQS